MGGTARQQDVWLCGELEKQVHTEIKHCQADGSRDICTNSELQQTF
jgi:hypothetical protein